MGIKIVRDRYGNADAIGTPVGTYVGFFIAILFFILGSILLFSGNLVGMLILDITAIIIVYASFHHIKEARISKLRKSGYSVWLELLNWLEDKPYSVHGRLKTKLSKYCRLDGMIDTRYNNSTSCPFTLLQKYVENCNVLLLTKILL